MNIASRIDDSEIMGMPTTSASIPYLTKIVQQPDPSRPMRQIQALMKLNEIKRMMSGMQAAQMPSDTVAGQTVREVSQQVGGIANTAAARSEANLGQAVQQLGQQGAAPPGTGEPVQAAAGGIMDLPVKRYAAGSTVSSDDVQAAYDAWQETKPSWYQQETPTAKQKAEAAEALYNKLLSEYQSGGSLTNAGPTRGGPSAPKNAAAEALRESTAPKREPATAYGDNIPLGKRASWISDEAHRDQVMVLQSELDAATKRGDKDAVASLGRELRRLGVDVWGPSVPGQNTKIQQTVTPARRGTEMRYPPSAPETSSAAAESAGIPTTLPPGSVSTFGSDYRTAMDELRGYRDKMKQGPDRTAVNASREGVDKLYADALEEAKSQNAAMDSRFAENEARRRDASLWDKLGTAARYAHNRGGGGIGSLAAALQGFGTSSRAHLEGERTRADQHAEAMRARQELVSKMAIKHAELREARATGDVNAEQGLLKDIAGLQEKIANYSGAMAREQMQNETQRYVVDTTAASHRYSADRQLEGAKVRAGDADVPKHIVAAYTAAQERARKVLDSNPEYKYGAMPPAKRAELERATLMAEVGNNPWLKEYLPVLDPSLQSNPAPAGGDNPLGLTKPKK